VGGALLISDGGGVKRLSSEDSAIACLEQQPQQLTERETVGGEERGSERQRRSQSAQRWSRSRRRRRLRSRSDCSAGVSCQVACLIWAV
jgi:hypothetical protein